MGVERHHLVVWQDATAEYVDVAEAVVPKDAAFAKYAGSWFDLRHRIEGDLGVAEPPKLVVYVGAAAPERDPLAELRAAAHQFELPLHNLVHQALASHLSAEQIEAVADTARTFGEAEAAAGTGVAPGLVSLVPILGAGLTDLGMVIEVLGGARDKTLDSKSAWGDVHRLVERTLGITTADTNGALRETVGRVLLLEAVDRAGVLPDRLLTALPVADNAQHAARSRVVAEWWALHPGAAGEAFVAADTVTTLANDTPWSDGLASVDVAPALESIAARHVLDLLSAGRNDEAVKLAEARAGGRWARLATVAAQFDDGWASRWRA